MTTMTTKEIKNMSISELETLIRKHCDASTTRIIDTMKRLNQWDEEEAILMLSTSKWYRDIQMAEMLNDIDSDIHKSVDTIRTNIRRTYGF